MRCSSCESLNIYKNSTEIVEQHGHVMIHKKKNIEQIWLFLLFAISKWTAVTTISFCSILSLTRKKLFNSNANKLISCRWCAHLTKVFLTRPTKQLKHFTYDQRIKSVWQFYKNLRIHWMNETEKNPNNDQTLNAICQQSTKINRFSRCLFESVAYFALAFLLYFRSRIIIDTNVSQSEVNRTIAAIIVAFISIFEFSFSSLHLCRRSFIISMCVCVCAPLCVK